MGRERGEWSLVECSIFLLSLSIQYGCVCFASARGLHYFQSQILQRSGSERDQLPIRLNSIIGDDLQGLQILLFISMKEDLG